MTENSTPTVTAVVAAYGAERYIGETLNAILGQTRPPDEIIVIDDGSTDGTARELARYGDRIRVVRQANGGYQNAMNHAIRIAESDYVALCGADDVWEPRKLEWQVEAIEAHPEIDVLFGHAQFFGRFEAEHARAPVNGLLDDQTVRESLFRVNYICTTGVVIRRALYERVGPFIENFMCEDYHYWFECMRAGARFYYDPRLVVRYRMHDSNMTKDHLTMRQAVNLVHFWNDDLIEDRRLAAETHAYDLFTIGRMLVDVDRPLQARGAFRRALRYARGAKPSDSARALAWVVVLTLPGEARRRAGEALVNVSRGLRGEHAVALS